MRKCLRPFLKGMLFTGLFVSLTITHAEALDDVEKVIKVIKKSDVHMKKIFDRKVKKYSLKAKKNRNITSDDELFQKYDFSPVKLNEDLYQYNINSDKIGVVLTDIHDPKIKIFKPYKNSKSISLNSRVSSYEVGLPNQDKYSINKAPKIASDNSIVHLNYDNNIDIAVQTFEDSVRILTVIKGKSAPTRYVYNVNIPNGGKLEKDIESGGVFVLDDQGNYIGGFSPPWALDNDGNEISTHYELEKNKLIQIVEHANKNVSYPIVADPWFGANLINFALWDSQSSGWRLMVYPTGWARANGGDYLVGLYGWIELYNRYKNQGLDTNLEGMKDQYICHQQFAFWKSSWNLDEWRPNVSYWDTVNALCNP